MTDEEPSDVALERLLAALEDLSQVARYVSKGRSWVDVWPYPVNEARRALKTLYPHLELEYENPKPWWRKALAALRRMG